MERLSKKSKAPPLPLSYWNAIPNVLWSVLCITPLFIFCYAHIARRWIYGFGVASLLVCALPAHLLRYFELSSQPAKYRALRVHLVSRFTQDSPFINALAKGKHPHRQSLRDPIVWSRLKGATYFRERFHWTMFVFFLLSGLYAVVREYWGWALLLMVANVIYNLYPIWLQQYIRLRLRSLLHR